MARDSHGAARARAISWLTAAMPASGGHCDEAFPCPHHNNQNNRMAPDCAPPDRSLTGVGFWLPSPLRVCGADLLPTGSSVGGPGQPPSAQDNSALPRPTRRALLRPARSLPRLCGLLAPPLFLARPSLKIREFIFLMHIRPATCRRAAVGLPRPLFRVYRANECSYLVQITRTRLQGST